MEAAQLDRGEYLHFHHGLAYETNELDELQQRFAAQKFEDTEEQVENSEEKEPKSSRSTPEGSRPPNVTQDGKRVMLVAAKSRVKPVAGSIARTIREDKGEAPILSAVGAASVNQAIKAIAIARDFLSGDGIDLSIAVTKRPTQDVKDVLVFALSKHPRHWFSDGEPEADKENENGIYQDMRSASNSTPGALAGAIANNVRLNKRPRITAIGQRPVFKAVCAIVLSRKYLKKENLDVDLVPKFTHVQFENGTDANAMQLIVIPKKLE